jgi:hypothetical protein
MDHTEAAPEQAVVRRPLWEQPVTAQETVVPQPDEGRPAVEDAPQINDEAEDPEGEAVHYPEPPRTGDAEIDEAIGALAHAVGGPLEERLTAFDAAHRTLQDRLADVEG